MNRISQIDIPDRLSPWVPVPVTQVVVGIACVAVAMLLRAALDMIASGGAPFALLYPAVILATLFSRWFAGVVATFVGTIYAWYAFYPVVNSFAFAQPGGAVTVAVIVIGGLLAVAIAEVFRHAARTATDLLDRQIADRDLFLAEFEHRVKNNFTIVASLLDMQRRRADPKTAEALSSALLRVDSIARAHRHLYRGGGVEEVRSRAYLEELCTALADALALRGDISLGCDADDVAVPRDRAVSMGLIVNELVTNAAKHAFVGRGEGRIDISFRARPSGGWTLAVRDDGVGITGKQRKPGPDGGLGTRLIDAFARQANGALSTETGPGGTEVVLVFEP